ncbi:xanthine dehydrogenase family protein molybdopterin-binding subunit [Tenggerimyces flavus]|uniref:Molybdopterin cofactor-binding domain-containing protein n=1 Tax=Tenggerimyces flavus TaxID=1708749 RepID=A0ABV7Y8X4_9ACTN|nr:molybdopterin cofactor-binding domain-containing protein [Tenggerimyces flavus]MBM7785639.1 CO/xanthine dehydrogenase Mo-binding subunit [Tenggerimyces flavus]
MRTAELTRRGFLAGAGTLAVSFAFAPTANAAPGRGIQIDDTTLAWLLLDRHGISIHSGKVELGTGVQTALTQIVLEELRLTNAEVRYAQGDTRLTPDQGTTAGSKTIQNGGPQLRRAAATAFHALLGLAAQHFGVPATQLVARDGSFSAPGNGRPITYTQLLARSDIVLAADPDAPLAAAGDYRLVGQSVDRVDLPEKVTARFTYLQDVRLAGMLHGRVIRPNGRNARFVSITPESLTKAQAIPGFVDVVQQGNFVGVVAMTEWAAIQAAAPATGIVVVWEDGQPLVAQDTFDQALRDPAHHYRTVTEVSVGDVDAALSSAAVTTQASYQTPFHMHAAMGPSCSIADVRATPDRKTGVQVTVWSGSQGVYALRNTLAALLGLTPAAVHVIYEEAAGCYGHNGADDVAADAALLSRAAGKPVRVQWSRQNEHGWEPLGPAMAHDLRGGVTDGGIVAWEHNLYTPTHGSRPNGSPGTVLAGLLTGALPASLPTSAGNSGGRNAPVTYAFPNNRLVARLVRSFETVGTTNQPEAPLRYRFPRTTALRSLGGFSNTFANESFVDELAVAGGVDPLELRLRSLDDPRALAVMEALRDVWTTRPTVEGVGAGLAFARYETEFTYVAVYAEVSVAAATGVVRVRRVVVAHDCGLVINPDGLRNQIEGCVIQGISRTLKEEVQLDARGVTSVVWSSYPVLRFSEVPTIETILIDRPEEPAWGAGEPAINPMPAAIANAVYAATGARIRTLPMTPARVLAALAELTP